MTEQNQTQNAGPQLLGGEALRAYVRCNINLILETLATQLKSIEVALVITKLEEASMWAEKIKD